MADRSVDVLIFGAGIAGLLLARELRLRGRRICVVHDPTHPGASDAAVGLLNPVRGPRCTLPWRAREAFAAAHEVYTHIASEHGQTLIRPVPVIRVFADADERAKLEARADAIRGAGFAFRESVSLPHGVRGGAHGAVAIQGGGVVDTRALTARLRSDLRTAGLLLECAGAVPELDWSGSRVHWPVHGISADHVVSAMGAGQIGDAAGPCAGALRPVHGEALLVHAPDLPGDAAVVCGHHLAPLGGGRWVCGGTKVPGDASDLPTAAGRAELEGFLHERLAVTWTVLDHWCGVRAGTLDTKPIVGPAPENPRAWVFNGLGSQGFLLGPWLARCLADHLHGGAVLPPEIAPTRFVQATSCQDPTPWDAVEIAHAMVERHLAPGDLAIDLTAGNGGDTLWLAKMIGADGALLAVDIQEEAIEATRRRLKRAVCDTPVILHCADHAHLASLVPMDWRGRVGAVVGNLGQRPGSSSSIATRPGTTVAALAASLPLLRNGGVLVLVLNTQHPGAAAEREAVEHWSAGLDRHAYRVETCRAPAASPRTPVVLSVVRLT